MRPTVRPHTLRRNTVGLAAVCALLVPLAACTQSTTPAGSAGTSASTAAGGDGAADSTVLRTAFNEDPEPLDPDTYYSPDGLAIMTAVYERLLRYETDSSELTGQLATDWEVSEDGLTYTFTLRDDVQFSDGTPFDAEAAKASFQRRIDVAAGPSYMLADVVDMQTPDPQTFVVTLGRPSVPFLHYLASPFGPAMISPTAVEEHAVDGDLAAGWLGSNSAGTGPYVLTEAAVGSQYTLTANEHYWGEVPYYDTVEIAVLPDFSVQRLMLERGDLDLILHGLSPEDYASLAEEGFHVETPPALFKAMLWLKPTDGVFADEQARVALRNSLDPRTLTEEIFGDLAEPSTDFYPVGMLPPGDVPDGPDPDGPTLEDLDGGGSVDIGYLGGVPEQELANRVQILLAGAGFDATVRAIPSGQVFSLPTEPDQRPDVFVTTFNPDAAAPDTWASIYNYTDAPVNLLGCSVPEGDALLDEARGQADAERAHELAVEAATAYRDSACWINIADVYDTVVARGDLTGWDHQPPWMWDTNFATLRPGG